MKKSCIILATALFTFSLNSYAGIRVQLQTASHPQTDTLYFNVENRIALSGLRVGDSIRIGERGFRANGDTVLGWTQSAMAGQATAFDTLQVFRKRRTAWSKRFVFRDPGKPLARVSGIPGPDARADQLPKATGLTVCYPDADFCGQHYIVRSFQMATYSKNNLTSLTNSNRAAFIPEQLSILKQLASGERIRFRRIVAGCEGCADISLPDVVVDIE